MRERWRGGQVPTGWPGALALRTAAFGALWWAFTEGRPEGWVAGVPVVALAVAASAGIAAPSGLRLRPLAALRLAGFFLWRSLRGGVDVAWRALAPGLPIAPRYEEVPLALPDGPARMLLAAGTSLMPGTLSVELRSDRLTVHVLDGRRSIAPDVRDLERRVAAALGVALEPEGDRRA
jgi:multicomponent Na+:H+ antiporter subunit E